mgnify:CR=1 FL=1
MKLLRFLLLGFLIGMLAVGKVRGQEGEVTTMESSNSTEDSMEDDMTEAPAAVTTTEVPTAAPTTKAPTAEPVVTTAAPAPETTTTVKAEDSGSCRIAVHTVSACLSLFTAVMLF